MEQYDIFIIVGCLLYMLGWYGLYHWIN